MSLSLSRRRGVVLALSLASLAACYPSSINAQAVLGPPGAASVPQVRRLTLDEARQIALSNNKSLTLARLNIVEKQYGTAAAQTDYFPKLLGSVTYFHFDQPLGDVITLDGPRGQRGLLPPA